MQSGEFGIRETLWTEEDIKLLRQYYGTDKVNNLLYLFPNRTRKSITSKAHRSTIFLVLKREDTHHLESFARDVGFNGKLYTRTPKNFPNCPQTSLEIRSAKQVIEDLRVNFSITPRKSLTLVPPNNLSTIQSLCFIIGYIDGDGSIFTTSDGQGLKSFALSVVGTRAMLEWIRFTINKWKPRLTPLPIIQKGHGNCYQWKLTGKWAEFIT